MSVCECVRVHVSVQLKIYMYVCVFALCFRECACMFLCLYLHLCMLYVCLCVLYGCLVCFVMKAVPPSGKDGCWSSHLRPLYHAIQDQNDSQHTVHVHERICT